MIDSSHERIRDAAGRQERLDYLDSLRGIAALLVVLHHLYQTSPFWSDFVRFSPLRLLLNGRSSVIFFFVLSGFVLAYGIWRGDQQTHFVQFAARRLARIYLPFLAAGLVAIFAMVFVSAGPLADTAITFNEMWPAPITWRSAVEHLLLLGNEQGVSINSPSWSLVYEIRISMLIPAFCVLLVRSRTRFLVSSLVVYVLTDLLMAAQGKTLVPYEAETLLDNLLVTIHFAGCFIVGIFLARAATEKADWLYRMRSHLKMPIAVFALLLLLIFRDPTCTAGSALVLVLALNTKRLQDVLRKPAFLFLGRISFSLYLTHALVLQTVVRALDGSVPLWLCLVLTLLLVVPVATLFYRNIEEPSLAFSKRIARARIPTIFTPVDAGRDLN
jgi:peptidoglycan/LPS O-acetylase OafA/YrhL